ncbi:hypothetical protein ES288_D02G138700v1 [Gossypium darwinii]|nr:hypothetical protein ES288_D02G138700v1 [Gossypium darwinii]
MMFTQYFFTASEFTGFDILSLSISTRISAPPEKTFFTKYGPSHFGVYFPRCTRSPSLNCLSCTFLL